MVSSTEKLNTSTTLAATEYEERGERGEGYGLRREKREEIKGGKVESRN